MTEPQLRELPARPYVGARSTITMDQLATTIDRGFPALFARAGEPLGPPFIRYHAFGPPELDIELGVPCASGDAELPGGEWVTVTHVGSYDRLVDVHASLRTWAAERRIELGDGLEIYVTDPRAEPDPSKRETEVMYAVRTS
jgi:GyrI-like small molecule binding domain